MGGSSKKTTTHNKVPDYINRASQDAIGLAQGYQQRPWQPYSGQRVAALDRNEAMGRDLAYSSAGQWRGDIDTARGLLGRTSERFNEADIESYMNPYVKGALDPAAREIREGGLRDMNTLRGQQASRGAFGGGRTAAMEGELMEATTQGIGDLYGRGYMEAFDRGADRWNQDRQAAFQGASAYQNLAATTMNMSTQDINNLMTTGATARGIEQMKADFDYSQFVESRDWDLKGIDALLMTLQGVKGSYDTSSSTKTENKPSALGQAIGLASAIGGAATGGLFSGAMKFASGFFGGQGSQMAPGYGMPQGSPSQYGGQTYQPDPWFTESAQNSNWGIPQEPPQESAFGFGGG